MLIKNNKKFNNANYIKFFNLNVIKPWLKEKNKKILIIEKIFKVQKQNKQLVQTNSKNIFLKYQLIQIAK